MTTSTNDVSSDSDLLARFVRSRDQAAFSAIVGRYAGVVYSTALRQVGAVHAEDVSQTVFFILAQKADRVDGRSLGGWLVNAARYAALANRRAETRRRRREQKAMDMNAPTPDSEARDRSPDWDAIMPLLDDALAKLGEKDRSALTLRYLQGKSVRDVAHVMNTTEAAAGKRATRAIERLRDYFARRGVTLSPEALGATLAAHGVVVVPLDLAGKLCATGSSGATLTGTTAGLAKGTLQLMVMTKTQTTVVGVVAVLMLGGGVAYVATREAPPSTASTPLVTNAPRSTTPPAQGTTRPTSSTPGYTAYATPAGQPASFSGAVFGDIDFNMAEVGIVTMKGVHWTSNGNYQWEPLKPDGTFHIQAEQNSESPRAIAVRAPGQVAQFFPVDFAPTESARDMAFDLKPTRPIAITAQSTRGLAVDSFKVEIFDRSAMGHQQLDHRGQPRRTQRLEAPLSQRGDDGSGVVYIEVPDEPICVLVSGQGVAPFMETIDPSQQATYAFTLHQATPIEGFLTENGNPIVNERVMLNNPAVAFSYTARKTDADGRFVLPAGIPGTYIASVRGHRFQFNVTENEPCRVDIDLAELPPTTQPTTQPTKQPIVIPTTRTPVSVK
jgi:RNA polymerase sigma factor (sigma-70 family)